MGVLRQDLHNRSKMQIWRGNIWESAPNYDAIATGSLEPPVPARPRSGCGGGRGEGMVGPRLQPLLSRHDVLPELVVQQGLRELERAALVEVRVVRLIHSGHG